MSDKYVAFENFKWGLDTRKSELTTKPGALLSLINAHINAGGEVEQRKSFAKKTSFPAGTFGLEATDSGLVTFGSISTPAGLPSGVTYQQLTAPSGAYPNVMSSIV